MAIDFPSSPSVGQRYQAGATQYVYDGTAWMVASAASNPKMTTSVTPPAGAIDGDLWFQEDSGLLFLRYDDGNSAAWVQIPAGTAVFDTSAIPKKNYITNGAMQVSQENGATAGTVTNYWPVDQFVMTLSTTGAVSCAQVASVTPGGSPNRLRMTVTTADTSIAAGEFLQIAHQIEGLRTADLKQGTANSKNVTLRFGVRAPAGTYGITFFNAAVNRFYIAEYVISAAEANIDTVKSVSFRLDTAGTWLTDNTIGMYIRWWLMGGSNFFGTPNVWSGTTGYTTANQFNLMGTVGNVFELFDVGLYEGTSAPNYVVPDFPAEKLLCRRYYQLETSSSAMWLHPIEMTQGYRRKWHQFNPEMRAPPTVTIAYTSSGTVTGGAVTAGQITTLNCELNGDGTPLTTLYVYLQSFKANARL